MAEVAVNGTQALPFQSFAMADNEGPSASTPTTRARHHHHDLPQFSFSPASTSSDHDQDADAAISARRDAALSERAQDGATAVDRPPAHHRQASHALPAFTFNPAADTTIPPPRAVTPPYAPTFEAPTTPTRGGRHRRSASEFIGGHGISKSIASSETIRPTVIAHSDGSANAAIPPVSPSKRGHRHKRSAAISQDLSNLPRLSKEGTSQFDRPEPVPSSIPEQAKVAAAPMGRPATPLRRSPHSYPQTAISDSRQSPRRTDTPSPPPRTASQTRVGFSDVVEVIPRPISIVSTGSDTSLSTILSVGFESSNTLSPTSSPATHARKPNGSISSMAPIASSASITTAQQQPPTSATAATSTFNRPSTPFHNNYNNNQMSGESNPTAFDLMEVETAPMPAVHQPSEHNTTSLLPDDDDDDDNNNDNDNDDYFEPPTNPDEDPTSVIISRSGPSFTSNYVPMSFDPPTMRPPPPAAAAAAAAQANNDSSGTMIDLDAALGPFNTPSGGPEGTSAKRKGFASARHVMHSSGTPFHRRTESAPTLVPMRYDPADSLVRPTSERGFPMENVFEEDEEDSMAHDATPRESPTRRGLVEATSEPLWSQDANSTHDCHSDRMEGVECISGSYTTTSSDSTIEASTTATGILKSSHPAPSSSSSSSRNVQHHPFLTPYQTNAPPDTPTTSSYPSAPGSATDESFQMHRLETASSSNTEGRRHRLIGFGGSGSELRQSVDDVPSLISCGSTATSTIYNNPPSTSSRSFVGPRVSAGSSLSISSSAAAERRRKRSSIASLSRLMTGPFTDKSTLSLDQEMPRCVTSAGLPNAHATDKKPRKLGRLFKFWKTSKDSTPSRTNFSSPLK